MIASELKEKMSLYVEDALPIDELEEWLIPRLPLYARDPNSEDADAVAIIELGLAEIGEELLTEEQLREQVGAILNRSHLVRLPSPNEGLVVTTSRSSNETVSFGAEGFRLAVNLTIA